MVGTAVLLLMKDGCWFTIHQKETGLEIKKLITKVIWLHWLWKVTFHNWSPTLQDEIHHGSEDSCNHSKIKEENHRLSTQKKSQPLLFLFLHCLHSKGFNPWWRLISVVHILIFNPHLSLCKGICKHCFVKEYHWVSYEIMFRAQT